MCWSSAHSASATLPPAAGYCAGDVAGERGGRAGSIEAWARDDSLAVELIDPEIEFVKPFGAQPGT